MVSAVQEDLSFPMVIKSLEVLMCMFVYPGKHRTSYWSPIDVGLDFFVTSHLYTKNIPNWNCPSSREEINFVNKKGQIFVSQEKKLPPIGLPLPFSIHFVQKYKNPLKYSLTTKDLLSPFIKYAVFTDRHVNMDTKNKINVFQCL